MRYRGFMCNRYVSADEAAIERFWHIGRHNQPRWAADIFPRVPGPFIRSVRGTSELELVVGQWGLIPFFARTPVLKYSTNNARFEEISEKASYKQSWARGRRCIIPAWSFDEPCWETGRNVWWRFQRADDAPWGLAGLWNAWTDPETGEIIESYTMLTVNADAHPLMSRMHKPDPKLPADQQDKRSVVAIEFADLSKWLTGTQAEAATLVRPPSMECTAATPMS
ncbi:SOS response-associated peptidase [Azoarcus sp. KH32C]|uniref:SOS response-associated peptidase n=1 Tax=Azoarcus sp. KH32C TaxID=748247 RepID=UPI00023866F8|nr:SOS response-associated peptidase family protein [Azoarcus sp. KH32C]BAL23698.1 hypothetical protein AZKH_1376 [Azoarcus sp. KH32C]